METMDSVLVATLLALYGMLLRFAELADEQGKDDGGRS